MTLPLRAIILLISPETRFGTVLCKQFTSLQNYIGRLICIQIYRRVNHDSEDHFIFHAVRSSCRSTDLRLCSEYKVTVYVRYRSRLPVFFTIGNYPIYNCHSHATIEVSPGINATYRRIRNYNRCQRHP